MQEQVYRCPMHSDVRQASPGKCPKCNMDLLLMMLRHMISNPLHLVFMLAIMAAVMAAAMMMMR